MSEDDKEFNDITEYINKFYRRYRSEEASEKRIEEGQLYGDVVKEMLHDLSSLFFDILPRKESLYASKLKAKLLCLFSELSYTIRKKYQYWEIFDFLDDLLHKFG